MSHEAVIEQAQKLARILVLRILVTEGCPGPVHRVANSNRLPACCPLCGQMPQTVSDASWAFFDSLALLADDFFAGARNDVILAVCAELQSAQADARLLIKPTTAESVRKAVASMMNQDRAAAESN